MQQIDQFIHFSGLDACDYERTLIQISSWIGFKRPSYLALLYLCISVLLIYLNVQPQFVSDFIGFSFPAINTLHSLTTINNTQIKWIIYWMFYSILVLSHKLFLFYAIPNTLYYLLRATIFIYLFSYGIDKIQNIVELLYQKYSKHIDQQLEQLNKKLVF